MAALDKEANHLMSQTDNTGLDSIATLLLKASLAAENKYYQARAYFFLSHFDFNLPDSVITTRLDNLAKARQLAEELDNDTLLCHVYNQTGVWELNSLKNIITAQYWFSRSMEKAKTIGREFSLPAELNLSETYRIQGDTMGLPYDLELYKYATEKNLPLPRFAAAFHCASHFAKTIADSASLRPYIDAMRPLEKDFPGSINYVYALHFSAKEDYHSALKYTSEARPDMYPEVMLLTAEILNKTGQFEESEKCVANLGPAIESLSLREYINLMTLHSSNLNYLGLHKEAFCVSERLQEYRDSVDEARSKDMSRKYRVEYEVLSKDREIASQKLKIRSLATSISCIAILILGAVIMLILWHRRKSKFYKEIVRQNVDFLQRQDILTDIISRREERIQQLESDLASRNEKAPADDKVNSRLSEDKSNEIIEQIHLLCDEKQVWRDSKITRDTFAEMVGCNRTYLAEVMKEKFKMGYSQYMNNCRIQEAAKVLSRTDNDTSLKELAEQLGFLSIQTFYSSFKQFMGMTPAAFKKTAKDFKNKTY